MQNLPSYIGIVLILSTVYTVVIFVKATGGNRMVLYILLGWLALQGFIAYAGFYTNTKGLPPRFILSVAPAILFVIALFVSSKGRQFLDTLQLKTITFLHVVRVPVEIVLFWLFMNKAIPQVMTFEGINFDVISGITAPIVWFITRNSVNKKILLVWNFICLGLLVNIVVLAILAAPFDFQQIAFDQPNIAVLYFPFVWLPACIVPLVLLSHLAAIRQLLTKKVISKE